MRNKINSKIAFYVLLGVFCFLIGFRYLKLESDFKNHALRESVGQTVSFTEKVDFEPDARDKTTRLRLGRVLITVPRYPEIKYGDVLEVTGTIENPPMLDGFNYPNYLKGKGIYFTEYNPEIKIIEREKGFFFYAKILELKDAFRRSVDSAIHAPESAIVSAMILGSERGISKDLQEKLNTAGVRHIIAVSGSNIVILSNILMFLFMGLRWGKRTAICLSLTSIFLFVVLCSFEVSAVRAAIMGSLFLAAPLFGRKSCGARAIILAGLLMLFFNPYLLIHDIGFQLSFLASLGMIYLSPSFSRWLVFVPNDNFFKLREILATTFSAYIFTLPILIYNFGQVSLFGILANIFILPIVPLVMISGFIGGVVGILIPFFGRILLFAPYLLSHYILFVVELFSKPWMSPILPNTHWFWPFAFYVVLIIAAKYIYNRERSWPYFLR
ncbi:MAG: ComEC/Rec2 family competence protein [bacterium]|nr:ComEC/Rec2 family competence protein [bacterium]